MSEKIECLANPGTSENNGPIRGPTKCTKCGEYAEFSIPEDLCLEHWDDWMTEGWDEDEKVQYYVERAQDSFNLAEHYIQKFKSFK